MARSRRAATRRKGNGGSGRHACHGAVLLGIPDDDAKTREHAGHLGMELVAPELPAGSVPGQCAHCDGTLRLDPQSGQVRHQLTRAGHEPPVVCLTCAHSLGMLGKTDIGAAGALARFKEKLLNRKGMPLMTVTEDDTTTGAGEHANQRPGNGKRGELMPEDTEAYSKVSPTEIDDQGLRWSGLWSSVWPKTFE